MFSNFDALQKSLGAGEKKTLVVAAAHDRHTLEAVYQAASVLPMQYVLVGDRERILTISTELGVEVAEEDIVHAEDDFKCAALSIALIREGYGNVLMKGLIETGILLKAVLDKEVGIRGTGTMSHLAMLEVPTYERLIAVTDGGMIPHPTLEQKADIIRNAVLFFNGMGMEKPNVAVLTAAEAVSAKMPETQDAEVLQQLGEQGELGNCLVEGPLSFDIAVSKKSAQIKKHLSKMSGAVDILAVPTVATGNILCKSLLYWANAKMAGCVLGATVPIVLVSRGATAKEKFYSIMLCLKAG